jgi:hypothetical protein
MIREEKGGEEPPYGTPKYRHIGGGGGGGLSDQNQPDVERTLRTGLEKTSCQQPVVGN